MSKSNITASVMSAMLGTQQISLRAWSDESLGLVEALVNSILENSR